MFSVKEIKSKVTVPKKNIKISGVRIVNGVLMDEEGVIVDKLTKELGNTEFTIKISLDLPDED